jgi:hypothetical protein
MTTYHHHSSPSPPSTCPVLLHIGSGDGHIAVTTTHLNHCSLAIGLDVNSFRGREDIDLVLVDDNAVKERDAIKQRKFVTLLNHLPSQVAKIAKLIDCTDLCAYDGVIDTPVVQEATLPHPPEALDSELTRSLQEAVSSTQCQENAKQ